MVTIHDDDEHLFPALQAGAFGYILKEQARELITEQLQRISQGEPPLSPSIARRVMAYFSAKAKPQVNANAMPNVSLTDRESEVLLRVAKGYTLPEIGVQAERQFTRGSRAGSAAAGSVQVSRNPGAVKAPAAASRHKPAAPTAANGWRVQVCWP